MVLLILLHPLVLASNMSRGGEVVQIVHQDQDGVDMATWIRFAQVMYLSRSGTGGAGAYPDAASEVRWHAGPSIGFVKKLARLSSVGQSRRSMLPSRMYSRSQ